MRLRYLTPGARRGSPRNPLLGRTPEELAAAAAFKVTDVMGFLYLNQAIDHMEIFVALGRSRP